ncbi:hypothetical protein THRCLA_20950 [Thraustotheca clavata]|uniref:Programmed cell death protein 2 C-terminal domain-containing protein n=1 Tax=Thraustotheca clavata TaxID=74557 RepID=A0A1W0A1M6_9STRA|nr:hypothetical protein THRCLA_20950 [Thraustotheca clavata]
MVVSLGLPQENAVVDDTCPFSVKLGGTPAYYSRESSVAYESLRCSRCEYQLYLVAQVYAPVTTDRTLYIFGCNSTECMDTAGSWRALRYEGLNEEEKEVEEEKAAPCDANNTTWGDDDSDDDWGDDGNTTWGAQPAVDLEALLQVRDDAMTTKTTAPVAAKPKVEITEEITTLAPHFAPVLLQVDDEPMESGGEKFAHEEKLLSAYFAEEEKENAQEVAWLKNLLKFTTDVVAAGQTQGEAAESYERTPLREKLFLKFKKRIKRAPTQCLRYNYGGEPLWPYPPPKLEIPKCKCGQERVFELQLVPTTNYFLQVEKYAASDSAHVTKQGGMDWQTVVVWSCPDSCALSHEEFVYAQPANND